MRRHLIALVFLPLVFAASGQELREEVPLLDLDEEFPPDEVGPSELQSGGTESEVHLPERVVSGSEQFGVVGGEHSQRGSLAVEADSVRERFNLLLELGNPEVKVPIEIILHGSPGDPPRKRPLAYQLRYTKDSFLLEIHVDLARGIDRQRMERAILSGLLYQQSLAKVDPGPLDAPLLVPAWLVEGLREAEKWSTGRGDRKIYEGVFRQSEMFSTDDLFEMKERGFGRLDGASRVGFRALSGAMVMALLEQPRGRAAFASFCNEVARHDGEMPILLRQHFPDLNLSEQSLSKWWALTLAKLSDAPLTEVLTVAESEKLLAEALVIRYRGPQGSLRNDPIEKWESILLDEESERFAAIRPAQDSLTRLSYRCFPSYRPLLLDYQQLLINWADFRKLGDLDENLAELAEYRLLMAQRADHARDYLDFMEIAGATELSGGFDDYIKLVDELEERPRPERDDPISNYLETMEKVYRPSERKR